MSARLMVHCGGSRVERRELAGLGTPAPTATWQPIPHATLLTEVEGALGRNGLRVIGEEHAVAREGDRYFGLLQVANGQGQGTRVVSRPTTPAYIPEYQPDSPDANADGLVAAPNVDPAAERVDQIGSLRAFQANLAVIRTQDEMERSAIDTLA